jgi:hypothetical protein
LPLCYTTLLLRGEKLWKEKEAEEKEKEKARGREGGEETKDEGKRDTEGEDSSLTVVICT